MNVLVVDIGNTSAKAGVFVENRLARVWRIETVTLSRKADRFAFFKVGRHLKAEASILATVVPSLKDPCTATLREITGSDPLLVSHRLHTGFGWNYLSRKTLGADRIANLAAVAAVAEKAAIVADFGTAATFDVVSTERTFIGGIIAPGLPLITEYMAERTALLPAIKISGRFFVPGKSTKDAMRAGARLGYRGLVNEIVSRLLALPQARNAQLFATGGYAGIVVKDSRFRWKLDHNLTLKGLFRLYCLNSETLKDGAQSVIRHRE